MAVTELKNLLASPGLYLFGVLILLQTLGSSLLTLGAFQTEVLLTPGLTAVGSFNTLSLLLCLLLLVPLVSSVRDFLQDLPGLVDQLRESGELSWLGDTGAGGNLQEGAQEIYVSVPDAVSEILGIAGSFFGVFLAVFTILLTCLFLLTDIDRLKRALASGKPAIVDVMIDQKTLAPVVFKG